MSEVKSRKALIADLANCRTAMRQVDAALQRANESLRLCRAANEQAIADREAERRRANAAVARGNNLVRAWRTNTPTMDVAIAQYEADEKAAAANLKG